jgi:hypothetical protein
LTHEPFFKERGTTFKEEENFFKLQRQKPLERKMRNSSDLVMRRKGECEKFEEVSTRVDLCLPSQMGDGGRHNRQPNIE